MAVASALVTKPDILVLDEPTTGLDAEQTDRMMEMLRLLHQQGHTIMIITHTMRLVGEYATSCVVLHQGQLAAKGSTRDILSRQALVESCSLEVPSIVRFSQRWGHTHLTSTEVRASLIRP